MISVELRRSFGPHDWQQQEEEEVLFTTYDEVLQSKLIRLPKVRNGECSATTVTSLDGCIFDTFVCHTYQMALSKYAFGMLTQEKIHDYVALFSIQRNPTYHII